MAIRISVPEAAIQFAALLDRVKQGEEVTIPEAGVALEDYELPSSNNFGGESL